MRRPLIALSVAPSQRAPPQPLVSLTPSLERFTDEGGALFLWLQASVYHC
jgi:hypothetical protein